jgi:hypothetical protein
MKILRTISGNGRLYRPGKRADLNAFERDFGDNADNLKRLAAKGAIALTTAKRKRKPAAKAAPKKTAPRRRAKKATTTTG